MEIIIDECPRTETEFLQEYLAIGQDEHGRFNFSTGNTLLFRSRTIRTFWEIGKRNRREWRGAVSRFETRRSGTSGTGLPERASIEPASTTRENNSEQRSCSAPRFLFLSLFLPPALYRHPEIWILRYKTIRWETLVSFGRFMNSVVAPLK